MGTESLSKNNMHRQIQIKPCDSWRYIDMKQSVCVRNWTVFISSFTSDTGNVQLSWAHPQHLAHDASTALEHIYIYIYIHRDLYVDPKASRPIETVANEASMYIYIYIYIYIYVCSRAIDALRPRCWEWDQDSWILPVSRAVTVLDFSLPRWSSNKYRGLAVNRTTPPPPPSPPVKKIDVVALVQVCVCTLQSHSTL